MKGSFDGYDMLSKESLERQRKGRMPIFEDPPPAPPQGRPGRKNPWIPGIMEAKKYRGKWLRLTEEPMKVTVLAAVKTRVTGYKMYSELDENDDFSCEVRRLDTGSDMAHLYIKYNGKRKW